MTSVAAYLTNSFEQFNNGQSVSKSAIGGDLVTFSGRYARFMTMEHGPKTDLIFKIAAVAIPVIAGVVLVAATLKTVSAIALVLSPVASYFSIPIPFVDFITGCAGGWIFAVRGIPFVKQKLVYPLNLEEDNKKLQSWLQTNVNKKFEDLPKMHPETVNLFADLVKDKTVDFIFGHNTYAECESFVFEDQNQKKLGELPLGVSVGFDKFNQPVISLVKEEDSERTVKFLFRANDNNHQLSWARSAIVFEVKPDRSLVVNRKIFIIFRGGLKYDLDLRPAGPEVIITEELSEFFQ